MLTKEQIQNVINDKQSITDFCEKINISRRTFYNYAKKYNIYGKNQKSKNKIKSTIGTKFSRWSVIEYIGKIGKQTCMLKCVCDCGTIQNIRYFDLINEATTGCNKCSTKTRSENCGRYKRQIGQDSKYYTGYKKLSGYQWSVYKNNAKKRNITFDISIEYAYSILEKQNFKCNISGLDIKLASQTTNKRWTATIDRIDSNKGYIEGNIQWLHKDINTMKWNFTQEQFINYCKIITERLKND